MAFNLKTLSAIATLLLVMATHSYSYADEKTTQPGDNVANQNGQDAKPNNAPPALRIEKLPGDANKGEVSCIKEFAGSTLLRTTIRYKNDDLRVEEFNSDGTARGIVELKSGELKTTVFTADGKGLKSVISVSKGTIVTEEYRPDGKTLWTRKTSDQGTRRSEYYGTDGKLRSIRTINKDGEMTVKVHDSNGAELYQQIWTPGFAGYVLTEVRERTTTGERRVKILGRKVRTVDHYKLNGSFDKTEDGDKLSTPFDMNRAKELDPVDDPTVPAPVRPRRR